MGMSKTSLAPARTALVSVSHDDALAIQTGSGFFPLRVCLDAPLSLAIACSGHRAIAGYPAVGYAPTRSKQRTHPRGKLTREGECPCALFYLS